jgi:iron complex outermembrane receptor protein
MKLEFNMAYQSNRRRLFGSDRYMVDMRLQAVNYELKAHINPTKQLNAIAGFQGNYTQSINAGVPNEIIPDYFSNDFSLFGLTQYKVLKSLNLQAGIRYDFRNIYIPVFQTNNGLPPEDLSRNYKHLSFTLGGTLNLGKYALLRLNLASAFRSPNVAELTQDGMHGNRYEQGNINLSEQKSLEADLGLHIHRKHWVFDISGFYNQLNNYIYLQGSTDTTLSGYPIYRYTQNDAAIYGMETGLEYAPWKMLNIKAVYNFTVGKQSNGMYLPFIPQNKIKVNLRWHKQKLAFLRKAFISIGTTYAFAQDNPAQFETASPDYALLNAGLGFSVKAGKQEIEIGIYGENLTNTAYIDHLSTLKDMGYYNMGRNIALKIRIPLDFGIN